MSHTIIFIVYHRFIEKLDNRISNYLRLLLMKEYINLCHLISDGRFYILICTYMYFIFII